MASFARLSRHKSLQVAQIALHGVTPHFGNYNKKIFNVALQVSEEIAQCNSALTVSSCLSSCSNFQLTPFYVY